MTRHPLAQIALNRNPKSQENWSCCCLFLRNRLLQPHCFARSVNGCAISSRTTKFALQPRCARCFRLKSLKAHGALEVHGCPPFTSRRSDVPRQLRATPEFGRARPDSANLDHKLNAHRIIAVLPNLYSSNSIILCTYNTIQSETHALVRSTGVRHAYRSNTFAFTLSAGFGSKSPPNNNPGIPPVSHFSTPEIE
jgi:hypothetical protein